LKGIRDDCIEVLNFLSSRYVHQNPFAEVAYYFRKYSGGQDKTSKEPRDSFSRNTRKISGTVTKIELGNLLESFKTNILSTISKQLDTLKLKKKQEEETILAIFYPRCQTQSRLWVPNQCDGNTGWS
jgi:hypothetical protein